MKDLLIKIKLFLEGQQAAAQAAAEVRKVDAATKGAAGGLDGLKGAAAGSMAQLAGFAAVLTGGVLVGVTAVTAVVQKMGEAFRESMQAAAESEASALKLNNALANTGQFSREASEGIQQLASEQQALTNVSDETWTNSAAKLVQYGAAIEDIPQYISIIEALAGRMDGDVPRATQAFIGAMNGTRTELQRMGFHVEEGATKLDRLNEIMRIASSGAGMLRQETQTLGGGWKALAVQIGDVWENLGKLLNTGGILTGTLRALAEGLAEVNNLLGNTPDNTAKLVKNNEAGRQFAGTLGEVGAAAGDAAGSIGEAGDAAEGAGEQMADAASKAQSYANALKAANEDAAATAQAEIDYAERTRRAREAAVNGSTSMSDAEKARSNFSARESERAASRAALEKQREAVLTPYNRAFEAAALAEAELKDARERETAARQGFKDVAKRSGITMGDYLQVQEDPLGAVDRKQREVSDAEEHLKRQKFSRGNDAPGRIAAAEKDLQQLVAQLDALKLLADRASLVTEASKATLLAQEKSEKAEREKAAAIKLTDPEIAKITAALENQKIEGKNDKTQTAKAVADAEKKATEDRQKKEKEADDKRKQERIKALEDELDLIDAQGKLALANLGKQGLKEKELAEARRRIEDDISAQRIALEDRIGRERGESETAYKARHLAYDAARAERDASATRAATEAAGRTWDQGVRDGKIDGRSQRHRDAGGALITEQGVDQAGVARSGLGTASGPSMLDAFAAETARRRAQQASAGNRPGAPSSTPAASGASEAAKATDAATKQVNAELAKLAATIRQGGASNVAALQEISRALGAVQQSITKALADLKQRVNSLRTS